MKRSPQEKREAKRSQDQRHAKRFLLLAESFDRLERMLEDDERVRDGWREHVPGHDTIRSFLVRWIEGKRAASSLQTRLGFNPERKACRCLPPSTKNGSRRDGRFSFGKDFLRFWFEVQKEHDLPWRMVEGGRDGSGTKVTASWIVCWLNGVLPDTAAEGWELFECSHRCGRTNHFCLEDECPVWESKSENQSRAGTASGCRRMCLHCGVMLCVCQKMHVPSCL